MAPIPLPLQWQLTAAAATLLLALLASVLLSGRCSSKKAGGVKLPPGPARVPVLGNLLQVGPLPHRSLRELARRHGPVMLLRLGTVPTVVVSSAEAAREVMKAHDADCCSRPVSPGPKRLSYDLKNVAFAPYDDYWREMRKLFIVELLSMRRVKAAWYARQEQVENLDTFLGGIDTSSVTMLWTMSELIRAPRVLTKVQDEIRAVVGDKERVQPEDMPKLTYLKMVVKETLRLHPPATLLLPRETMRDVKIGGYDVPAKTRIFVNAWAIGRDAASWDDPEDFNPDRFETKEVEFNGAHFELVPFGAGRRICPGLAMGAANVEFTLANLLHCFDWALPDGVAVKDVSMEEAGGLTFHRKTPLVLVPSAYAYRRGHN
ncbi:hypothetical protein ABZP36_004923 [Zizania latifolia]